MADKTCISIRRETRNKLAALAGKDVTFDMVVQKLLAKWDEAK